MRKLGEKIPVRIWKVMTAFQCMSYGMAVNATSLENTQLVVGIKNLATDMGRVALVIEAVVLGVLEVVEGLKYQFGEEDEKPKHVKAAKRNLAIGALIMAGSGLVTVILSYFQ